ncbi:MAG: DUF4058 family protein [Planctomycetota bacterium]
MPSPFPGMDPFIESQEWDDFHARAIIVISELVSDVLPSGFAARVERRVYFETDSLRRTATKRMIVQDDSVVADPTARGGTGVATATPTLPRRAVLAQWEEIEETFLEIRDLANRRVVTTLELISPGNKRPGRKGRKVYIAKRAEVLRSRSHFVEIDLLRGGRSLCPTASLPETDYYAVVSRAEGRPAVDLFAWNLRDRLPVLSLPLQSPHADVSLDLQHVRDVVYDRVRYADTIDYSLDLMPKLDPANAAWVAPLLDAHLSTRHPAVGAAGLP